MNEDVKRRIELYFVGVLRGLLEDWSDAGRAVKIVPSRGGDDTEDADEVEPPFVLARFVEGEQVLDEPPTYQATVKVAFFAHMSETTAPAHSVKVGQLGAAVRSLRKGYYASTDLTINGVSLVNPEEVRDDGQKIHGDVFVLSVGATEGRV